MNFQHCFGRKKLNLQFHYLYEEKLYGALKMVRVVFSEDHWRIFLPVG